jgi:hypothetical protein
MAVLTAFTVYCNKVTDEMKWVSQLLIYADDVIILGGKTHSVKKTQ